VPADQIAHIMGGLRPCLVASLTLVAVPSVVTFATKQANTEILSTAGQHRLLVLRPEGERAPVGLLISRNGRVWLLLCLGATTAGLLAVPGLVGLGAQLGAQLAAIHASDIHHRLVLAALLPHGIAEFCAFILAGGVGLSGPGLLHLALAANFTALKAQLRGVFRLAALSLMMLLLAALLEAYLTPVCIRWASGTASS
jgi:uncharacterized membrane protein SpoIIM required for sporulation